MHARNFRRVLRALRLGLQDSKESILHAAAAADMPGAVAEALQLASPLPS
jgi:hypothetical protein